MFRVLNSFPPAGVEARASWRPAESSKPKRSYSLIAVASRASVARLNEQLSDWLSPRAALLNLTRLDGSHEAMEAHETGAFKAVFRFEADDTERHALAELVQHLCLVKGVRYLRLEPGALPFSTGVFHE